MVVGDAKQSIYRFRRAEVALFREGRGRGPRRGRACAVLSLTQNFRSRPAILRFVNRVFAELIQASDEAGQPAYEPIAPPPGLGEEPSVVALRFGEAYLSGRGPAAGGGARPRRVPRRRWPRARGGARPASGDLRPSRAGDVMVLARRLTQVRLLEEALEAAALRFTVEGGKSFFDRQEVHEILAVLRAVEDPTDRVSLVAALRSSFFGVSDRDIVAFALSGGELRLRPSAPRGATVDPGRPGPPPCPALCGAREPAPRPHRGLGARPARARSSTRPGCWPPSPAPAAARRRSPTCEKVVTLARRPSDLGVLTLRGFTRLLAGAHRDRARGARPARHAARAIPTPCASSPIHKAKGLEAPVVALFDTADNFCTGIERHPAVGGGHGRHRLPQGLPAAAAGTRS